MHAIALFIFLSSAAAPTDASALISPPVAISHPNCAEQYYPRSAARAGVQGTVVVALTITAQGDVTNLSLKKLSGNTDLDDAALACMQHWRFAPAMKDNTPVEVSRKFMVAFLVDPLPEPLSGEMVRTAQKCAMQSLQSDEEFNGGSAATTISVQFAEGAIAHANVLDSSGNKELDQRAEQCVESLPTELVQKATGRRNLFITFPWKAHMVW
jgi:TonB family protein